MPTIATEIERVRKAHNIDSFKYSDTDAMLDFNKLLRESGVLLRKNWDTGTWNIVADQNEYQADELLGTPNVDILDIKKVYVDYWNTGEYARSTLSSYDYIDTESYSTANPKYIVKDQNIFLYPTPESNVTNGIKIECTYLLKDYVETDNVEDIPIPRPILDTIFRFWFSEFIEYEKGNKWDAVNLRNTYRKELSIMKGLIGTKAKDVRETQQPNLSKFTR